MSAPFRDPVNVAFVYATQAEAKPLLQAYDAKPLQGQPYPLYALDLGVKDQKAVCLITGVGKIAAEVAMRYLMIHAKPSYVVNAGLAGSLLDEQLVGEVVQVDTVYDIDLKEKWDEPKSLFVQEGPWAQVMPVALASVDRAVTTEKDRQRLCTTAHVVDMEGFGVAQVCADFEISCLILKAVSDRANAQTKQDFLAALPSLAQKLADTLIDHMDQF